MTFRRRGGAILLRLPGRIRRRNCGCGDCCFGWGRFQLHRRDLPGTPDIVLAGRRKIVEVRGCFWHRHPDPACRNAVLPKVRAEWWAAKLARNVERDARNLTALQAAGWSVLVLWECEVRDEAALAARLRSFLG